jgi:AhpD family alkylhydroperoxidase
VTAVDLIGTEQAPITAQPLYANGDPGALVGAFAHVPELLEVTLPFIGQALGPATVDLRTKEIVVLRTSAVLECRYCTQTHTVVAREAGLSLEEVHALRGEAPRDVFDDPREQTLLDWIDAVALGPGSPPAAVTRRLREHYTDYQVVDLTATVGATLMLNRFATSLGLPTSPETLRRLAEEGLS